jgi:hypothetical protein
MRLAAADSAYGQAPTLCLVTRLTFRRWVDVVVSLVAFRRMRKACSSVPGFVDASMRILPGRTTIIVSLWVDEVSMAVFQTLVPEHVRVVRWTRSKKPLIWSSLYELVGRSKTSSNWGEEVSTDQ